MGEQSAEGGLVGRQDGCDRFEILFCAPLGMHSGKTVFSQLTDLIHREHFSRLVRRYSGERRVRHFSCWEQFHCLVFAQLTYRESLRDIEACLGSCGSQLYHLGFRSRICRSTLAEANETRDWRIFADLATHLMAQARRLYAGDILMVELAESVFALDSTTIELCLSLFPWAGSCATQAGVKLHTLLELRGPIPSFVRVTTAMVHDVNALDWLLFEPGAYYVMDRGYVDYARLYELHEQRAFFVIREKDSLRFIRHESRPSDPLEGICSDQIGVLRTARARAHYPEKLRRLRVFDAQTHRTLVLLTNAFQLPAKTCSLLYRSRWRVELFFKWIKQHLRIKSFFGRSANAVKTQLWIAICTYTLVAIWHRRLKHPGSLHSFLQVLSVNAFAQVPLVELLPASSAHSYPIDDDNQLLLNIL